MRNFVSQPNVMWIVTSLDHAHLLDALIHQVILFYCGFCPAIECVTLLLYFCGQILEGAAHLTSNLQTVVHFPTVRTVVTTISSFALVLKFVHRVVSVHLAWYSLGIGVLILWSAPHCLKVR